MTNTDGHPDYAICTTAISTRSVANPDNTDFIAGFAQVGILAAGAGGGKAADPGTI